MRKLAKNEKNSGVSRSIPIHSIKLCHLFSMLSPGYSIRVCYCNTVFILLECAIVIISIYLQILIQWLWQKEYQQNPGIDWKEVSLLLLDIKFLVMVWGSKNRIKITVDTYVVDI